MDSIIRLSCATTTAGYDEVRDQKLDNQSTRQSIFIQKHFSMPPGVSVLPVSVIEKTVESSNSNMVWMSRNVYFSWKNFAVCVQRYSTLISASVNLLFFSCLVEAVSQNGLKSFPTQKVTCSLWLSLIYYSFFSCFDKTFLQYWNILLSSVVLCSWLQHAANNDMNGWWVLLYPNSSFFFQLHNVPKLHRKTSVLFQMLKLGGYWWPSQMDRDIHYAWILLVFFIDFLTWKSNRTWSTDKADKL